MTRYPRYVTLIALLLCLCLAASGCDSSPEETTSAVSSPVSSAAESDAAGGAEASFVLAYTSNDTLNPYSAQTKNNQELTTLLYDSLINLLDENMEPEYVIADTITLNGTSCIIELKDVRFSDGSSVTAEDVTYSIEAAKGATNGRDPDRGGEYCVPVGRVGQNGFHHPAASRPLLCEPSGLPHL